MNFYMTIYIQLISNQLLKYIQQVLLLTILGL